MFSKKYQRKFGIKIYLKIYKQYLTKRLYKPLAPIEKLKDHGDNSIKN